MTPPIGFGSALPPDGDPPNGGPDPAGGPGAGGPGAGGPGAGGAGAGGAGAGGGFPGFPGIPGFGGMPGFGGPGGGGPGGGDLGAVFAQLGRLLSWQGGTINWDLARDVARQTVAGKGDRSVSRTERDAVDAAVRLAELWLDPATTLSTSGLGGVAWSRAEWIEGTLGGWRDLVDPVAERVVAALGSQLPGQLGELAPGMDVGALGGQMAGMLRQLGGAMFGAQIGQAVGELAGEVFGTSDVGIPMARPARLALLPANIDAFGGGLGVPVDDVRLYLALRECAHQRLAAGAPWLRAHLVGLVEEYARGVNVDTDRLRDVLGRVDPADPQAVQDALGGGLFEPEDTPAQRASLARLETVLALVEGWVDDVVSLAVQDRLPSSAAIAESVRRRRAAGGPAEQTFATLVGLELRPRRLREAGRLWAALRDARGVDGRDAVWAHPDLLPSSSDLDDPLGYVGGATTGAPGDQLTEEDLSALTSESTGDAPVEAPADERGPNTDGGGGKHGDTEDGGSDGRSG